MLIIDKTKSFLKESAVELKRVSWLSKNEIIKYTILVLAVSFLVAAFLGGLDYIFSTIIKSLILR